MFRPQIQKTKILVYLAIINLLAVYIASQNTDIVYAVGYDEKKRPQYIYNKIYIKKRDKSKFLKMIEFYVPNTERVILKVF